MDENRPYGKKEWIKRSSGPILFLVVLVAYFTSEALLRRTIYKIPEDEAVDKDELVRMLPNFLQGILKDYAERVELKEKLRKSTDPEERAEILYELAVNGEGEDANVKLLMRAIEETPHSPDATKAWMIVLKHMSDEEILDKYVHYVLNCDIRRPQDKVRIWQLGALALADGSKEIRREYLKRMLDIQLCSDQLTPLYEELWIEAEAEGDLELGRRAKALRDKCAEALRRRNMDNAGR